MPIRTSLSSWWHSIPSLSLNDVLPSLSHNGFVHSFYTLLGTLKNRHKIFLLRTLQCISYSLFFKAYVLLFMAWVRNASVPPLWHELQRQEYLLYGISYSLFFKAYVLLFMAWVRNASVPPLWHELQRQEYLLYGMSCKGKRTSLMAWVTNCNYM